MTDNESADLALTVYAPDETEAEAEADIDEAGAGGGAADGAAIWASPRRASPSPPNGTGWPGRCATRTGSSPPPSRSSCR